MDEFLVDTIRAELLAQIVEDRAKKQIRSDDDYVALFPGHESLVRNELSRLRDIGAFPTELDGEPHSTDTTADEKRDDGRKFGRFILLDVLGKGSFGTVYLAKDPDLSRTVALKVLTPGLLTSGSFLERFKREARVLAKISDAGLVPIHESGIVGDTPYIAMEHVKGATLASKIKALREQVASTGGPKSCVGINDFMGPTNTQPQEQHSTVMTARSEDDEAQRLSQLLEFFEATARALHSAHEQNVIHRDIKPGNIMVDHKRRPVIVDFGLAHENDDGEPMTLSGDWMGTPAYMSPQQLLANRVALDRRTDIWSLGVSLFECITLTRPFDAPTKEGMLQAILTKPPPDIRRLNPAVPKDLAVVLATALEKDLDRRYSSAEAFAEDLRRVRCSEPILAKPIGVLTRFARWTRREPLIASLTFGVILLLLGFATYYRSASLEAQRNYDRIRRLSMFVRVGDLLEKINTEEERPDMEQIGGLQDLFNNVERCLLEADGFRRELNSLQSQHNHDEEARFRQLTLTRLCEQFDAVDKLKSYVKRRLSYFRQESAATTQNDRWNDCIQRVRQSTAYGNLHDFKVQLDLVPIRENPSSGLWEFVTVA